MLNREGWSLLAILLFFLALLGAGFAHMGRERSVADRLREGGGAADTAAGLVVAAGGVVLLAIVPGTLYLYGLSRLLMPLSLAAGACALLCGILPRLRAAAPRALSAAELYSRASAPRAAFAVIGAMSALGLATGAIALLGRVIAGVFSLHQTLALGAAALLCAILALLCGPQSRRRMDRLQVLLLVGLLAALPASAVLHSGDNDNTLAAVLASAFSRLATGNPVPVDMLSDLGAAALLCAILALLCGPQSRRRMDRLQVLLLVGLLAALPASAVLHSGDNDNTLAAVLASAFSRLATGNPVPVDMLSDLGWGLGVLGAVSLLSRATAVQEEYAARYGGRIGAALLALLTVLSAAAGLLGRMVEEGLTTLAAAETVLLQEATNAVLPAPVSALLVAALTMGLLLSAQGLLRAAGNLLAWDVAEPVLKGKQERPLCRTADGIAVAGAALAFLLALDQSAALTNMAQAAFLLGAVLGAGLALRAFGRPTTVLGAWVSLAAGAGVVVAWTAVPALGNLGMLGALPSAGAVALVQWLLRPRQQEAPAPQPETVSEAPAPAEEREAEPARSEGEENDGTLAL